jgi:hypothetical protein
MGRDLAEPDWWRILDALMLISAHPATSQAGFIERESDLEQK